MFVDSIQASNETTIDEDIPVFILAGGDRASLVDVFQQTHLSNQNATLKTEHEIVILEENSFFHSAYDGQILTGTDTALPCLPKKQFMQLNLRKVSFSLMRRVTNLAASGGDKKDNDQWSFTCDFGWSLHPSFSKNDPSRIQIQLTPSVSAIDITKVNNVNPEQNIHHIAHLRFILTKKSIFLESGENRSGFL